MTTGLTTVARIDFFAKVFAGFAFGLAPLAATKRLSRWKPLGWETKTALTLARSRCQAERTHSTAAQAPRQIAMLNEKDGRRVAKRACRSIDVALWTWL